MVIHALVKDLGYGVTEVAAHFGRNPATISSALSRLADRALTDQPLQREICRLSEAAIAKIARPDPVSAGR